MYGEVRDCNNSKVELRILSWVWMWPKHWRFQILKAFIVALSIFARLKVGVPTKDEFQAYLIISRLKGSLVQNYLNLKDLGRLLQFKGVGLRFVYLC